LRQYYSGYLSDLNS